MIKHQNGSNSKGRNLTMDRSYFREVFLCKRSLWLLTWPIGFLMYALARISPDVCETLFTRGLYRVYGTAMSYVTGWLPFSLAEFVLVGAIITWIVLLVRRIVLIIKSAVAPTVQSPAITRRRGKKRVPLRNGKEKLYLSPLGKNEAFFGPASAIPKDARFEDERRVGPGYHLLLLLRNILMATGIVFVWFMLGCGTNYYRHEFADIAGYKVQKSSTDELYAMCLDLAERTNGARKVLGCADDEVFSIDSQMSMSELAGKCSDAMTGLADKWPDFSGYYPKPKGALISRIMSEFNITGFYFPWTVEANVDIDISDYAIPYTMCHELAHLRGFMRENEANFIGYYACVTSDNATLNYSGYMLALILAGNKLYADSPELYRDVAGRYDEGVWTDLIANSEYWSQFEDTTASRVGEKMNDTYLKATNQKDGTKSYGRMVDLLLAKYREEEVMR